MSSSFDQIVGRQHALVTTRDLERIGWTWRQVQSAERSGRLIRIRRAVYRVAGAPVTQEQAWLAAVLAGPPGALLSHGSAARLWRVSGYPLPDLIDVLCEGDHRPRLPGVSGHRTLWLPAEHRTRRLMIPVTTPERTLVDACGLVAYPVFENAVDDAIRSGIARLPRLARCADTVPVSGRRRIAPVRAFLSEVIPGYDPGGSRRELDVLKVLRRSGLPLPSQQVRVVVGGEKFRLDYAWVETKHALEFEGFDVHGQMVSAFHNDRRRVRALKHAGWQVWPVTSRTTESEILAIQVAATRDLLVPNARDLLASGQ